MSRIILRWQCVHWNPPPPSHPHRRLVKSKLVPKETFSWKADHNINKELQCALLLLCGRLADRNVAACETRSENEARHPHAVIFKSRNWRETSFLVWSKETGSPQGVEEKWSFIFSTRFYCNRVGGSTHWQTGKEGIFLDVSTCWICGRSLHWVDGVSFIHYWCQIMNTLVQTEISQQLFDWLP